MSTTDGFTVRVHLAEFREQLEKVRAIVAQRCVEQGLRDAGKVIRDAARMRAPVLRKATRRRAPGAVKKALAVVRIKTGKPGVYAVAIYPRTTSRNIRTPRDPYYWYFLEKGWIPQGPGKRLRGSVRNRSAQRKALARGGAARYQFPFIEPAFQAASGAAQVAFEKGFTRRLEEAQRIR